MAKIGLLSVDVARGILGQTTCGYARGGGWIQFTGCFIGEGVWCLDWLDRWTTKDGGKKKGEHVWNIMQDSVLFEVNIFFFFRKERLEKIFAYYICWKNLKSN